jgi:DUF4097 and DUF4098 domain-containing protein YvlB
MHSASGDVRCVRVDGRSSATSTSGSVEVGSAGDRVDARSTSGDVRLGDVAGDASIVAVSGSVQVLAAVVGTVHIRSVSGDVSVGIAQGVSLRVDVQTMSGKVHSDIPINETPSAGSTDALLALTVRSVSGDVRVERAVGALL